VTTCPHIAWLCYHENTILPDNHGNQDEGAMLRAAFFRDLKTRGLNPERQRNPKCSRSEENPFPKGSDKAAFFLSFCFFLKQHFLATFFSSLKSHQASTRAWELRGIIKQLRPLLCASVP
jgi:hypothetical protein